MKPSEILKITREHIRQHAGDDPDKFFYANRFVFARLQLDERKIKTEIKRHLFKSSQSCHYCGKPFALKTGIHLHRMDSSRGYSRENCVLMHNECHQRYHIENHSEIPRGRPRLKIDTNDAPEVLVKQSKRHEGIYFTYWWDATPSLKEKLNKYDTVEFRKKDTGEYCRVPPAALTGFLTEDRRTSSGQGNWRIKVLKGRENELAFEPGRRGDAWLFLSVAWINDENED